MVPNDLTDDERDWICSIADEQITRYAKIKPEIPLEVFTRMRRMRDSIKKKLNGDQTNG